RRHRPRTGQEEGQGGPCRPSAETPGGRPPMKTATKTAPQSAPTDLACKEAALRISGVAHPVRLGILILLEAGPMHVGAIVEAVSGGVGDSSQAAISHHLNILKMSRVIEAK